MGCLVTKCREDHGTIRVRIRWRQHTVDEANGCFMQDAIELAGRVALDDAAGGITGMPRDAGEPERQRVCCEDVAAGAREHHRPVWNPPVEIVARRTALLEEFRLVEAATLQPRVPGQRPAPAGKEVADIGQAAAAAEIEHRRQQMADLPDMGMRIGKAGHKRFSMKINQPRVRLR